MVLVLAAGAGAGALVSLYTAAASSFVVCSFRDFRCQTLLCGQVLIIINNNLSFHPLTTCRCQEESARCWLAAGGGIIARTWRYPALWEEEEGGAWGRRDHRHMHISIAAATAAGWVAGRLVSKLLANCFKYSSQEKQQN